MKTFSRFLAATALILGIQTAAADVRFEDYFTDKTLRFDFLLAGNWQETHLYPVQMKAEPSWAGSKTNLADPFNYGNFRYSLVDETTGTLLFMRGFSALFQEWQTTPEAKKTGKAYYQAVFSPFPKNKVILKIEIRNRSGDFQPLYETVVDPGNYFILREIPASCDKTVIETNGLPENKADIVFLAEGYTAGEKEKFISDVKRMRDELYRVFPFSQNKEKFNITAVWTPSEESGMDIPGQGMYKNTRFNSTFYTFDLDRYLTTSDMKSVYDAAAGVPWDFAVVLVNTAKYGGGGFYNLLTVCTSNNRLTPKVFAHEFGHAFAGLADEYYSSSVSYEDFYNLAVEPWEPNITMLVNFSSKWKSMVPDSIPIPTPRSQVYRSVTGVYEGGGYMEKGIYSPRQDCRMKSNETEDFCPVCSAAIQKTIDWYAK
jgi:IgA Peptidase M64/Peptidase M64 N-terminus